MGPACSGALMRELCEANACYGCQRHLDLWLDTVRRQTAEPERTSPSTVSLGFPHLECARRNAGT